MTDSQSNNFSTYEEGRDAALADFQNGRFAQAMEIFDAIRPRYAGSRAEIDYFRSCLAVRLNDPALAYQIFDSLLADHIWFSEDLFRKSPSYLPLQGAAGFEERVAAHLVLREQQGAASKPGLHTLVPQDRPAPFPLIFHLHGNDSRALAEIEHWQAAAQAGWLVAALQSASTFWAGGGSFWPDHETARPQIRENLSRLRNDFFIAEEKIIFAGFSMGGDVALAEALKGELAPACGFVLVAPGGPLLDAVTELEPLIAAAQDRETGRRLKGAILFSAADAAIQAAEIEKAGQMLNAGGIPTRLEEYPDAGHVYPADFAARLPGLLDWISAPD